MNEVIINKGAENIRVCVLENGSICENYSNGENNESMLGNIYVGKVETILNNMNAAFVNIGSSKNAFISLKDALPKIDVTKESLNNDVKISEVLKTNQLILVQVRKEPTDEKGARISTHITLPGNYIVLMPDTDIITVSQKIEDSTEGMRTKEIVKNKLPKGFGAIIRTDAESIDKNLIESDIDALINLWDKIQAKRAKCKEAELIYDDHDIVEKTIRDVITKNTNKVYINDDTIKEKVRKAINTDVEIKLIEKDNIFAEIGLETELGKVNDRKVWLKCGGHIAIDKTEALTAIDVNSGKCTGSKDLEDTILKVNREAAIEIMKQIRLKDIGGIIIIDFIDMKEQKHKEEILNVMRNEGKKDRSKLDIRDFTQLNLVEMTRKKLYI